MRQLGLFVVPLRSSTQSSPPPRRKVKRRRHFEVNWDGRKGTLQLVLGVSHEPRLVILFVYLDLCCSSRVQRMKGIQIIANETRNIPSEAFTMKRDEEEFVGNGVTNVKQSIDQLRRTQLKDRGDESEVGRLMTLSNLGSASTSTCPGTWQLSTVHCPVGPLG